MPPEASLPSTPAARALPPNPAHDLQHAERELQRWSRRAIVTVAASGLALLAWAAIAPLDSAVVARGFIRVEDSRQVVQHRDGGLVKAILVQDGSRVRKGQPLIELEDSRIDATYGLLEQQYHAELARQARLAAERDFLPATEFPPRLRVRDDPDTHKLLATERALFEQRRQTLNLQIEILRRQIAEVEREVLAARAQVQADQDARASMEAEVAANRQLLEKGYIASTRLLGLQRNVADYEARLAEHQADLSRALQKQNELKLKIEEARNTYREQAVAELKESSLRQSDLEQQVRPAQDARERQVIVAPADGEVVALKVRTVGAAVGPRETLMEIVPQARPLVAEVRLTPDTVSELRTGMPAEVRLLAFQLRSTPLVPGTLSYVSADVLTDASGEPAYTGHVTLDAAALQASGLGALQPGMPVEIYLRTRERNALTYFIDPIRLSLSRAFRER